MPIIQKISLHKQGSYRIEFAEEDGMEPVKPITIGEDVFVKYQLSKGKYLRESDIQELVHQNDVQKAFNRAANYLSRTIRSTKQVQDYLAEKGFPPFIIDEVIDQLKRKDYLDDSEFTRSFIRTQIKTTDNGPVIIMRQLREKGIDEGMIEKEIEIFSLDKQFYKADMIAKKWAARKKENSVSKLKADLQSMLLRKGYSNDVIEDVANEVLKNLEDDHNLNAIKIMGAKAFKRYGKYPPEERRMRVKQYLFRKGFSVDLINDYMNGEESPWEDE